MIGTPALQMLFGLMAGAFLGIVVGWSLHPLLSVVGLAVGGVGGVVYAGVACLVCGTTLDWWVDSIRGRRHLSAAIGLIVWLFVSAVVTVGAFAVIGLAAR